MFTFWCLQVQYGTYQTRIYCIMTAPPLLSCIFSRNTMPMISLSYYTIEDTRIHFMLHHNTTCTGMSRHTVHTACLTTKIRHSRTHCWQLNAPSHKLQQLQGSYLITQKNQYRGRKHDLYNSYSYTPSALQTLYAAKHISYTQVAHLKTALI
jgi:hypothetical protein